MSKKLTRKELKERKRRSWDTIKDDNKDLKMSEAKDDYDKAMDELHKAHDKLVVELEQCKAALKKCQDECHRKDEEIAALNEGARLAPGNVQRQTAQEDVEDGLPSGFSDDEEKQEESREDTSDGTSSGTSDDEEEEDTLPVEDVDLTKKLRF